MFYVIAVLFAVLPMNLFIGVLGAAYDREEDVAQAVYAQELAAASLKLRYFAWVRIIKKLVKAEGYDYTYDMDSSQNEDAGAPLLQPSASRRVFALVRDEPDEDALRSMRSCMQESEKRIKQKVTQQAKDTKKELASMKAIIAEARGAKEQLAKTDAKIAELGRMARGSKIPPRPAESSGLSSADLSNAQRETMKAIVAEARRERFANTQANIEEIAKDTKERFAKADAKIEEMANKMD